ncbi:MAG: hypothetical protein IMZ50_00190 [Candidatus Atribacteria bacterium]|nr:hypothetical protein [Candidatus Atribacteria bacterium]
MPETILLLAIVCGLVWFAGFCWLVYWNWERMEPHFYIVIVSALWMLLGLGVLAWWAWRRTVRAW